MKCRYCGKELNKGLSMHERFCKSKPSESLITHPEKIKEMKEFKSLKEFLEDAPLWTKYKPSLFQRITAKMHGKTFISCVFVGENRPPRVVYLPYDPERNRLIIDGKGYFFTPISGNVAFFHEDLMLPLVNAPDLSNRFQLPAHVPMFTHAQGLAEGKAEGFDDLIKAINKYQMITVLVCILGSLCLIVTGYFIYQSGINENNLVQLMNNMTQQQPIVIGK